MIQPGKDVSDFTTARTHYFNSRNTIERISTGSRNIDAMLCSAKAVTEFYGAPNSGKTQLCHTMCAMVPQDISDGGVCGKSTYIDTEGTFREERVEMIARARKFDFSLDNILLVQPEDSAQQERIADDIDSLLKDKTERYKLLVVDSPVTHYRSEYIGRAKLPERQQRLYKFIRRVVKIAHEFNIAVVVTNHINRITHSKEKFCRPIGGDVMGRYYVSTEYRVQNNH